MRFRHEFLLDERMIQTFDSLNISYLWVEGHQGVTLPGDLALDVCDKGLQKRKEDSTLVCIDIYYKMWYILFKIPFMYTIGKFNRGGIWIKSRQSLAKAVES
jgi:hypothetical protein